MLRVLGLYIGNEMAVKSRLVRQTLHLTQGRGRSEPADQGWAITFLSVPVPGNKLSYWARASKTYGIKVHHVDICIVGDYQYLCS